MKELVASFISIRPAGAVSDHIPGMDNRCHLVFVCDFSALPLPGCDFFVDVFFRILVNPGIVRCRIVPDCKYNPAFTILARDIRPDAEGIFRIFFFLMISVIENSVFLPDLEAFFAFLMCFPPFLPAHTGRGAFSLI